MERIGICDWGIGGIGMLQHLREMSNFDIVYLSDAGYIPYGKVAPEELRKRWEQVKSFFKAKGVTKIAVACNALSTVVESNKDFVTVIESGLAMVCETKYQHVGITGGYRTIESNAYLTPLEKLGFNVEQSIGQVLSARVEAGDLDSDNTRRDIITVFEPLKDCEVVLLACTHYPVLSGHIKNEFPQLLLLDPALKMAKTVADKWKQNNTKTQIEWNTTGNLETMIQSARISFQEKIETPIKIEL